MTSEHSGWRRRAVSSIPILTWLPRYERSRLKGDLLAGAIVAALMVPQSLGYARIAGVPVEVGLYAVPLALLAYAVLGSSPQLIVGPASTVAIVSGSLVADIARDNPEDTVAITSALAIAAGIVLIATGLLRIAWVAEFLNKPIVTGFVFGLTLTIVIGELPTLLGLPKPPGDLLGVFVRTLQDIGDAHVLTTLVGGVALLVLFGGRWLNPKVPWGIVTLIAAVVAAKVFDLEDEGVATVGDVPSGLPPIGLPLIPQDDLGAVIVGGAMLALVALAEGLAATRLFATRGGYRVETERELVGMGAANVGAGLSGGLGVAGSLSKTAAAEQSGSASQVSGLAAAGLVVVVLMAFTWFFTALPLAVLSAIVIAAVWGLMDLVALQRYRRVRRADFVAAMVGIGGVVLFGPLPGLGIAIVTSLMAIIYRSSAPRMEVLGRISGEKAAWGRMRGHTTRRTVPGIVVVRLDVPLFWANAMAIEDRLLNEVDQRPDTRALVLDLEATSQMEATSTDMLEHLHGELEGRGVKLYLARVINPVSSVLENAGFLELLGDEHIWHSISQCVRAARRATGLKEQNGDQKEVDGGGSAPTEEIEDPLADEPEAEVLGDEEYDAAVEELYAGHTDFGNKRDNVVAFYLGAYRDGRPHSAAATYVGDRFEDHRSSALLSRDELVERTEQFIELHPSRYVRVARALEDAPYVFLHVFESLDQGETERVAGIFFTTDDDDRIVGRWGVIAPYTHDAHMQRTPIDGPGEVTETSRTEENKGVVRTVLEDMVIGKGARDGAAALVVDPLIEHCANYQDEGGWFRRVSKKKHRPLDYRELVVLVGDGNFVATLCAARQGDVDVNVLDVFRLEHGRIIEHWHEVEPVHGGS
jgi:high affinity sulfate transporter 1